jgi:putative transposase
MKYKQGYTSTWAARFGRRSRNLLQQEGCQTMFICLYCSAKKWLSPDVLREIKSASSKWIHDTLPKRRGFAWQAGYGAFAVSHSNLTEVTRYIANQTQHHRARSYQEVYRATGEARDRI